MPGAKQNRNSKPATLGELKNSGYQSVTVRNEMRRNLIRAMEVKAPLFEGIVGYEESVIPQIQNAILAGQDLILLGERGQAKSRIIRSLVQLLDAEVPIVTGSEINDDPLDPVSKYAQALVEEMGDDTPVEWIGRDRRYGEKLATPDISIADLIGDIDPIRIAEGRYLSDELAMHYGLIPRTNRGIFCINELPDLAERIQVGLFNLMEERDVQIKGYRVRLPLDVVVVASANPEDYTNRGRIITPLKDRYGAQVRTHYPRQIAQEIDIMEAERGRFEETESRVAVPRYMKEVIAEFTSLARRHPEINQRSGVSVRVSIANYETVLANALRRAIMMGEELAVPRPSDLSYILSSTLGKIELETMEEGREARVLEDLTKKAVLNIFDRTFSAADFEGLLVAFEEGATLETGADVPSKDYVNALSRFPGFTEAVGRLDVGEDEALIASGIEFVLEGLHLNRRLNRDRMEGRFRYRG
ncbi:MAG: magnesium chelatase [Dehalococcoidia bacterium]